MNKFRLTIITLFAALTAIAASAQTARLRIPDMTVQGDKEFNLPIELVNDVPVVGVQFELFFPENASVYYTGWPGVAEERKVDHVYMQPYLWDGRPTVDGISQKGFMVYSPTNEPFIGNSGPVAKIALGFPSDQYPDGSEVRLKITDVVITTALGENIAVEPEIGTITIAKGPDLEVKEVSSTAVVPGEEVTVKWRVNNVGTLATGGGWRENIALVSNDGTFSRGLTTVRYDNILEADGSLQRSATFVMPSAPAIDGNCKMQVTLSPNSDTFESPANRGNNSETCGVNVAKRLYLDVNHEYSETYSYPVRVRVERSGSTADAMTFNLTKKSGDHRMTLPAEIVIPAGSSSEYFYFNIVDDEELNSSDLFTIAAGGNGYPMATADVTITDNELPSLTATLSAEQLTEGESFTLAVEAQRAPQQDLTIGLYSAYGRRLGLPSSVVLPAGQTQVSVDITVPDNEDVEEDVYPVIRVSANGYNPDEVELLLADDDMPSISMTLTPTTVKESAGPYAMTAKITRHDKTDRRVTIKFSDTSKKRLIYRNSIVLEKGVEEAEFTVGVADNTLVDGDEEITFTAAVYMSSCSCTAGTHTGGAVDILIKVLDNDGPSLTVVTDNATWLEGSNHTITVSRNTDPAEALTVELSSDKDAMLEYEQAVTIPAGQSQITIPVSVLANDVSGDGGTATFMAQAADHSLGACFVLISDQTLPDAIIASISVAEPQVGMDDMVSVAIGLRNEGAAAIPERAKINVYSNGSLWFTVWSDEAVAPGATLSVVKKIAAPQTPIAYNLSAAVNEEKGFEELSYSNNRRDEGSFTVLPGFVATISLDKTVLRPGQTLTIAGNAHGTKAYDADVEVYLIGQTRIVIDAHTDANGNFTAQWAPFEFQNGHFDVGACYPGENLTTAMGSVDVYGIAVKTDKTGIEPAETDAVEGSFTVSNSGSLPLTNVVLAVASKPDNCSVELDRTSIASLAPGEEATVGYTLVGNARSEGRDWQKINFSATAAEEVSSADYVNFYCHPLLAVLETDSDLIEATATRGQARDYSVRLTNRGRGETGPITLAISVPWIKAVTPTTMPSLASGQSADIVLSFRTDGLQLNVEQSATIGINCAKGDGIPLRIKMTPVSETVGTITLDACDQYTYRTEEAPHVKDATVTIKSPNTYKLIAEGKTGDDGHFTIELPEGYYDVTVSAPDHATYNNTLMVNPGRDTFRTVNLSFTGGVTVTYNVEPVEGGVEDEYEIVTTVVYETHVPAPVVVLDGPDKVDIDAMAIGESQLLYYYATNKGLITALDYEFFIPEDTREYTFRCLAGTGPFDLAPNQMVAFPVMLTKIADIDEIIAQEEAAANASGKPRRSNAAHALKHCVEGFSQKYSDLCGESISHSTGAKKLMMRTCALAGMFSAMGGGSAAGPSGGGGGGNSVGGGGGEVMVGGSRHICDHDTAEAVDKLTSMLANIAIGQYNFLAGAIAKGVDWGITGVTDGYGEFGKAVGKDFLGNIVGLILENNTNDVVRLIYENYDNYKTAAGIDGPDAVDIVIQLTATNGDIIQWTIPYYPGGNPADILKAPAQHAVQQMIVLPDWLKQYTYFTYPFIQQLELLRYMQLEMFGDEVWMQGDPDVEPFLKAIQALPEDAGYDAVRAYKPTSVSHEQAEALFQRIRNAKLLENGQPEGVDNCPDLQRLYNITNELRRRDDWAKAGGFESCAQVYEVYRDFLNEHVEMAEASICSHVTLQFTQKMVMTREAFRGTLTVYNGHDDKPMKDAVLNLTVLDPDGNPVTKQKMDVSLESVNKFTDLTVVADGVEWKLGDVGSKDNATATVLYIPTKYAAPDKPLDYTFQGSLTYVDPFTDMTVTEEFMPTTLTVNPSPNLDMTYFMQRDIFGDDPLTEEVEPIVPAEFSVLINNVGNGDAMNVKMTTKAPEIIENEKGLLIDFDLYGSALNGSETTMAIGGQTVTDFGAIPAGKTAFAQWWFTSTLLGHFIDYDVKATHVTSHDNPDLTLLNDVTIHELIRSVKYGPDPFDVAFLCDDIFDRNDTPDHLYLSNGTVEEVNWRSAYMQRKNAHEYWLKSSSTGSIGWTYANAVDYAPNLELISVTRNDGKEIDLRNVWTTDRTLRDGHDPLYENKIHIVDFIEDNSHEVVYLLQFADRPSNVLEVVGFDGLPGEKVLEDALEGINVVFNAAVDPETFTTDDLTLTWQGKHQDASLIGITQVAPNAFHLDLTEVTKQTGYYVLTVQTTNILDSEGNCGNVGKQATWSQMVPLKARVDIVVEPEGAGTVDVPSGYYIVGSVLELTAKPAENFHFVAWNDEIADNPYALSVSEDCTIVALFAADTYRLTYLVDNAEYHAEDVAVGTVLVPIDEPVREGYTFSGWSEMPETMPAEDVNVYGWFQVSAIEAVMAPGQSYDVYSVGGLPLLRQATLEEVRQALPAGIYVVGSRKVLLRGTF